MGARRALKQSRESPPEVVCPCDLSGVDLAKFRLPSLASPTVAASPLIAAVFIVGFMALFPVWFLSS